MKAAIIRLRAALVENRRALLWVILTYVPAVVAAGYLGELLWHTDLLAFLVGGGYMLVLMALWFKILMAVRDRT